MSGFICSVSNEVIHGSELLLDLSEPRQEDEGQTDTLSDVSELSWI